MKRKLTKEEILSIPDLYNSGLSSLEIAKKFDTQYSNVFYHLRKLGTSIRDRSSAAKEGVKAGRIKIRRNKIPNNLKLNQNLSYILGVLCGDGYMDYNIKRMTYYIGLSATDREFVEEFKKALYGFFKIIPTDEFRESRKENWKAEYLTRLCSKEACDYVKSIGNFKKEKWIIPQEVKNANKEIRGSFLKGFFDSQGEIDKKIGRIGATSMNFESLEDIGRLLNDMGIRTTIIKKTDKRENTHQKYLLRMHDQNSIRLFDEFIGFTIQRKQKTLKEFVSKWTTHNQKV